MMIKHRLYKTEKKLQCLTETDQKILSKVSSKAKQKTTHLARIQNVVLSKRKMAAVGNPQFPFFSVAFLTIIRHVNFMFH